MTDKPLEQMSKDELLTHMDEKERELEAAEDNIEIVQEEWNKLDDQQDEIKLRKKQLKRSIEKGEIVVERLKRHLKLVDKRYFRRGV